MTKQEADFIGSMNMCDEISNEAYKKIMCHCEVEEQQPCEDCISRQTVINAIANTCFWLSADNWEDLIKCINSISPITPAEKQEPCTEWISREFIEIVVDYPPANLCIYPEYKGKPYFSIKYRENDKEYVGFGTYNIKILSQWIKEYFISDAQPKTEWIPVSERLPDTDDEVLCWYEYYHWSREKVLPEYGIGGYLRETSAWFGEVANGKDVRVIAWMPLPQPYVESEGEE